MSKKSSMEITIPHRFIPRHYQIPILQAIQNSKYNRFVWVSHRRSGKDKTVLNAVISKMIDRVGTYYYFFPTYSQGKRVLWQGKDKDGMKFLDHFPFELIKGEPNNTEMRIKLKNGSTFQVIGADNIDNIVGTNPIGVVFSEYSLMKAQVWEFIRPILAENSGFAVFVFTPRGMNEGWKILQIAKENPQEWWWEVLTVENTKAIPESVLFQERKEMPADLFDQEYYVKFIDGASSVFRRIEENIYNEKQELKYGKRYQIGIDLAKYQDFTVISIMDLHTFYLVKQIKLNHIDWSEQKEIIIKEIRYWNKARTYIDSTGVGDPIVEDLKKIVPVESFHFNETSRAQLLNNLQILFEQDKIKIPNEQELTDELKSMQYELVGQKVKMKVPEGLHDDRIMSLGLACWGLSQKIPYRELSEALREQKEVRRRKIAMEGLKIKMINY